MEACVYLSLPHFVISRREGIDSVIVIVDGDSDANATEVIVALCN